MENYLVRIYRRSNKDTDDLLGMVERPDSGENKTFKSFEELYTIFSSPKRSAGQSKLKQIVEKKKRIIDRYQAHLMDVEEIRFIQVVKGSTFIPFRVAIFADRATDLMQYLESQHIECRTFFYPLHRQPAFKYLIENPTYRHGMQDENFPGAIYAYANGVCLPSYPGLPQVDQDYVCEKIKAFYGKR